MHFKNAGAERDTSVEMAFPIDVSRGAYPATAPVLQGAE